MYEEFSFEETKKKEFLHATLLFVVLRLLLQ